MADPSAFPSLTCWCDATDLAGTADATSITSFADKSGASRHYAQYLTQAVPTKETRAGYPCLQFLSASSQWLKQPTATLSTLVGTAGFMAIVVELNGNPSKTDATNYYADNFILQDQGSYFAFQAATIASVPGIYAGVYPGSTKQKFMPMPVSERHVLMMWRTSGSILRCSLDGAWFADVTSVGAPSVTTWTYSLGGTSDMQTRQGNFWLYEVVQSTANGTDAQRLALLTYLGMKWSVPVYVPPDAIAASTNLTGAVTAIDETVAVPDANWLTATSATAGTDVRVTFPTPS